MTQFSKNTRKLYRLIKSRSRLWLLGLVLTIALAACPLPSEKVSQPPTSSSSPAATTTIKSTAPQIATSIEINATRPWKFVVAIKDKVNDYGKVVAPVWEIVWESAQKAAADFGVEVTLLPNPCQTCVKDQIKAIDSLTKSPKIDGLVIGVVDSVALSPVVEKLIDAGIPVIALDTPLTSNRLLTSVGFDNFAGGKAIGEWVVGQLQGKGQVAILNGPTGQQNAIDRGNGILAGLQQSNIEIVATGVGNWETDLAKKVTTQWLSRYPKLKAIVAASDKMALGAYAAAKIANRSLLITAFDTSNEVKEAIKNGAVGATISQGFDRQARLSIQLLIRHLEKKETFPPFVVPLSEITLITKNNVSNYY